MIYTEPLANIAKPVTTRQVEHDAPIVAEFVDYIRWLAEQDTGFPLTAGVLWELYHESVLKCRYWSEVAEDLKLPVRDEW